MIPSQNLLFADLARQLGILSPSQVDEAEACLRNSQRSFADIVVERGWLSLEDRRVIEHLIERRLQPPSSGSGDGDGEEGARTIIEPWAPEEAVTKFSPRESTTLPVQEAQSALRAFRYRLKTVHAVGGMGRVWRAWDEQLQRDVALKELRPDVGRSSKIVERFLREARLTGQLEHPGIISVHDLSSADAAGPFYAMRLMEGRTLKEAIDDYHRNRGTREADELTLVNLLAAFVATCNTVAYAHSHGIVHRDLKGQNVLLGDFGEVVVADWGLAKTIASVEHDGIDSMPAALDETDAGLTMQGQVIGTPAYMSPEQASGRLDLLDHRTDIYGLGAILYEILAGRPPFVGSTTIEVLLAAQQAEPVPPSQFVKDIPQILESICLRALARDREERYSSASELAREVQRWQESQRQAAETELRASRERFELAVRGSQDGLWDWDLTTGDVYFSPRWKSLLGYDDHEIANRIEEWDSRLHPDERERVLAANYAHINGTTDHYEYEYRLRHKDGTYRWILARGVALRDAAGKAYRMAGSHVDVTERRRTEQRLREVEQRHQVVMELMPQALVVVGPDGVIQFANAPASRRLNLDPSSPLPHIAQTPLGTLQDADGAEIPAGRHPVMAAFSNGGLAVDTAVTFAGTNGTPSRMNLTIRPLLKSDESIPSAVVACFWENGGL